MEIIEHLLYEMRRIKYYIVPCVLKIDTRNSIELKEKKGTEHLLNEAIHIDFNRQFYILYTFYEREGQKKRE